MNIVAAIARMVNPGDLKIGDVLAIDLIQSGVARPAVVTMGTMPGEESFAVRTAIGAALTLPFGAGMIWLERQLLACGRIFDRPIIFGLW